MPVRDVALIGPGNLLWDALRVALRAMADIRIVLDLRDISDGRRTIERIASSRPDVIVVGWPTAGGNAILRMAELRADCAASKILVLGDRFEITELRAFADIGIDGWLLWRDLDISSVRHCFDALLCGDLVITSRTLVMEFLNQPRARGGSVSGLPALTERERLVLQALAQGHSQKEIASAYGLSPRTIRRVVSELTAKLQATTCFLLGARAQAFGLVSATG